MIFYHFRGYFVKNEPLETLILCELYNDVISQKHQLHSKYEYQT